jgi:hypothetical protein
MFAAVGRWFSPRLTYRLLPFDLVLTFVLAGHLSRGDAAAGIAVFGLAGLRARPSFRSASASARRS